MERMCLKVRETWLNSIQREVNVHFLIRKKGIDGGVRRTHGGVYGSDQRDGGRLYVTENFRNLNKTQKMANILNTLFSA